ncbi:hypothetical protein N1F89_05640 [Aquibium sp. A9E412]|uniref:hypothetical protein n=1 Tax=Aquibium sp. A9E412 TaxID=2976767 RepID=UPI0025AF2EBC|nr:hypothetical protein [Aquibium sp. A9E412]MDN2565697.1 hypothetical protein [Aquibium sp. A9E412]
MKIALLAAAAFGASVATASAACPAHTAQADVDKNLTVASVATDDKAMTAAQPDAAPPADEVVE